MAADVAAEERTSPPRIGHCLNNARQGGFPWASLVRAISLVAKTADRPRDRGCWRDVLLRTKAEFDKDHIPLIAAGVTFFIMLAVFPALAAFVSLYGLFSDAQDVERELQALSQVLPGGAVSLIGDELRRLTAAGPGELSVGFVVGLVTALWSANGAARSLILGLNIAYEAEDRRGFVRTTLVSLSFTGGLMPLAGMAIGLLNVAAAIEARLAPALALPLALASWAAVVALLAVSLALLYRFGPNHAPPVRLRWISWGSAAVICAWLAMTGLFSLYVANFGHYDRTYGALGAAVGFMTWVYLSNLIVLGGAELNAELERQDPPLSRPRPPSEPCR